MSDKYASVELAKADAFADVINRMLQQLIIKCAKSEGIRDYYHIGVIGYSSNDIKPAFSSNISNKNLVPISEIANNPTRIEERPKKVSDGAGGLVDITIKFPIWFDAAASGGTPMTAAFVKANEVISAWLTEHPDCFPPIVIHITDGESTDGDPTKEMKKLTEKISSDGNVILFNLHTHSQDTNPITFPNAEVSLPNKCAEMLFNGASFLPEFMRNTAAKEYNLTLLAQKYL